MPNQGLGNSKKIEMKVFLFQVFLCEVCHYETRGCLRVTARKLLSFEILFDFVFSLFISNLGVEVREACYPSAGLSLHPSHIHLFIDKIA
jgi:hypothetical protein